MMCTKGELSAKSQEQRLRNYDPANNLASKVMPSPHFLSAASSASLTIDFRESAAADLPTTLDSLILY